jgi:hypothetical protein
MKGPGHDDDDFDQKDDDFDVDRFVEEEFEDPARSFFDHPGELEDRYGLVDYADGPPTEIGRPGDVARADSTLCDRIWRIYARSSIRDGHADDLVNSQGKMLLSPSWKSRTGT